MHHDAAAPACRQCDAPIDVNAMGFVDLTRPLCAACSGAPAVPSSPAGLVGLAPAPAEPRLVTILGRADGRLQRAPAIRDLVRSVAVAGPPVSVDLAPRAAEGPRRGATTAPVAPIAPAAPAEVRHDLRPGTTVDLRDGAPGGPPVEPTLWTERSERAALRELLNRTRPLGIEVLHDRHPEGSLHPIDHVVVAPSGVWVIDSMGDTGRVHGTEATDFLRPAWRLFVGGVDRTVMVDDVRRRAGVVRNVLVANGEGRVPVRPILCFSDAALGSVTPPFAMTGVLVTSRRHVVEPFSVAPGLDRSSRRWVRDILSDHLPGPG